MTTSQRVALQNDTAQRSKPVNEISYTYLELVDAVSTTTPPYSFKLRRMTKVQFKADLIPYEIRRCNYAYLLYAQCFPFPDPNPKFIRQKQSHHQPAKQPTRQRQRLNFRNTGKHQNKAVEIRPETSSSPHPPTPTTPLRRARHNRTLPHRPSSRNTLLRRPANRTFNHTPPHRHRSIPLCHRSRPGREDTL